MPDHTVALLVLPQASLLSVASTLDPLRCANRHLGREAIRWTVIAPMADNLQKWKEQSRMEGEARAQAKEDKLKKQVVEKAKRTTVKKKVEEKAAPTETIAEGLDKLISDKDLEI